MQFTNIVLLQLPTIYILYCFYFDLWYVMPAQYIYYIYIYIILYNMRSYAGTTTLKLYCTETSNLS